MKRREAVGNQGSSPGGVGSCAQIHVSGVLDGRDKLNTTCSLYDNEYVFYITLLQCITYDYIICIILTMIYIRYANICKHGLVWAMLGPATWQVGDILLMATLQLPLLAAAQELADVRFNISNRTNTLRDCPTACSMVEHSFCLFPLFRGSNFCNFHLVLWSLIRQSLQKVAGNNSKSPQATAMAHHQDLMVLTRRGRQCHHLWKFWSFRSDIFKHKTH